MQHMFTYLNTCSRNKPGTSLHRQQRQQKQMEHTFTELKYYSTASANVTRLCLAKIMFLNTSRALKCSRSLNRGSGLCISSQDWLKCEPAHLWLNRVWASVWSSEVVCHVIRTVWNLFPEDKFPSACLFLLPPWDFWEISHLFGAHCFNSPIVR